MRTVAVVGSFLAQSLTGVQRYARSLCRALTAIRREYEFVLVAPPGAQDADGLADRVISDSSSLPLPLWIQLRAPRLCPQADLWWSPGNVGPLLRRNQLLTLHDASIYRDPSWFSWSFRRYYRLLWPWLARRVRGVLTVSEFSRSELAHFGITTADRIRVVPCGVEPHFRPVDPGQFRSHQPYALAMGGNPRKNLVGVLDAWKQLQTRHQLVVLDSSAPIYGQDPELPDGVTVLRNVADTDMPALYSGADLLVYPSLYEGFGLPPLEAAACGTPSLVSDVASLPEIFGDAVRYCQPDDASSIAHGIEHSLASPRTEGLADLVQRFSWKESAQRLHEIFSAELVAR